MLPGKVDTRDVLSHVYTTFLKNGKNLIFMFLISPFFFLQLQEILANYSPWGKPGGGAPCAATLRKRNVLLEPIESPRCRSFGQRVKRSRHFSFRLHSCRETLSELYCRTWYRLVMLANTRNLVMDFPCMLDTRHFSRGNNFERAGWTSNSTIDRLYKRNTDPPAVVDVNKFYDDRATPGIALETQMQDPRNLYKEEVQVYELTGGVELVPLLTSRRHQSYPQSSRYLATDATRPGYTIESLRALGVGNREYVADLAEQIRRKRDRALEERRIEHESCRRHFDTWKRLWGRPGHGAPIDHTQRNNLYNILHRPAIY
ncbi:hypothetical protein ALC62_14644 [Cyphomyrmex costatus]|uniref:Uncharacterized protein n=1 Tax=Cyphomyrmex costatus TaxID=456900 RepID=A0A195C1A9_9HYME|nr:hypothetical protein ALC62_14644 [Cyphomyrmex costatus]